MYDLSLVKGYLGTFIGKTIIQFDELASTNAKAKSIFDTCPDGTVILSENQSDCRVRFKNKWYSNPYKNIYLSIILKPKTNNYSIPKFEIMAAASVFQAVSHICGELPCEIKWPNDIMLNRKKVSSISCELIKSKGSVLGIIVYMGINVNTEEQEICDELKGTATSLKIELKSNEDIEREKLIGCILNCFEGYYNEFTGFDSIDEPKNIWLKNFYFYNRKIKISKAGKKTLRTVLPVSINNEGRLVVNSERGDEEIIDSGEVNIIYE